MNFGACSDEETYDFPGDSYNRVYLIDNSNSYKIVQTPIGSISNLEFETSLNCTREASEEIKAMVMIDNSMVATYNKEHGTNYEAMPESALVIENATMNIPAGTRTSITKVRITTTEDKDVLATLKNQNGYLIPLRLAATEGGNAQPSTNVFSTYLTVLITEDNVNHSAVESDITGTLVANQSGWSAITNGKVYEWYDPIESLFDGNKDTSCYITASEGDLQLDINMGKSYTFDAITLYANSYWGGESGSLSNGMSVYTSDDGTAWKSVGEITGNNEKFCVFYAPLTSQYIRLVKPNNGSSYYGTELEACIFNIYAK